MKHVYGTDEIAHLWAHKTQGDARNQQGNFYFDGDTIYSYGRHFPIARHVVNARGEAAVLFTTRGYSSTTAKHISLVRRAVSHLWVLWVNNPGQYITERVPDRLKEFDGHVVQAQTYCFGSTGRFKPTKWTELEELIGQANNYAEFFGSRKRWALPENSDGIKAQIAKDNARREREQKKQERAAKLVREQRAAKALESLATWRVGERVDSYLLYDLPFTALRIDHEAGEVETTRGARFPVEHARKGVTFVRAVVARGEDWVRNGHTFHLGHYAIDRVEADGTVHAGCHVVGVSEVELIAAELGMGVK